MSQADFAQTTLSIAGSVARPLCGEQMGAADEWPPSIRSVLRPELPVASFSAGPGRERERESRTAAPFEFEFEFEFENCGPSNKCPS